MSAIHPLIVGDDFRPGFRFQRNWGWSMATAFFFGEIGAGLFLASLYFGYVPGMWTGVLVTAVGKTTGHMLHLGQPLRAWRAIMKVNSSWVSRGLLAIILYTGFGIVYLLSLAELTFGLFPKALEPWAAGIAAVAAIVITLYQGFAMSHSAAIALWSTGLMPVIGFTYALLAGVSLLGVLGYESVIAGQPQNLLLVKTLEFGLVLFALVQMLSLIHAARYGSKGGQESVALLTQGDLAKWFLPLVFGVGFILPALMIPFAGSAVAMQGIALAVLAGYYTFRVLVFKAGMYDPIQSFKSQSRRF